jgi:hypothetical protein
MTRRAPVLIARQRRRLDVDRRPDFLRRWQRTFGQPFGAPQIRSGRTPTSEGGNQRDAGGTGGTRTASRPVDGQLTTQHRNDGNGRHQDDLPVGFNAVAAMTVYPIAAGTRQ